MSRNEYEVISHNNTNFHVFLVNLLYRTPHLHKDYEISLILDGEVILILPNETKLLQKHDIFLMNPFQSHELKADSPVLILSLQIAPAFFAPYFPQIDTLEFDAYHISAVSPCNEELRTILREIAESHLLQDEQYELQCASFINRLFFSLLRHLPYHKNPDREQPFFQRKATRMRTIMDYMDSHYAEKLLLSDIAEQEELNLYYLSHFFKECFGMTFQNYLSKIRCEYARQLLLLTDLSLLDISIRCGFSDPKYFNKGFCQQYGCTPKEYRKNFEAADLAQQQKSMLSTQEFLSVEASLVLLQENP